ncbi:uncharacterized protein LOC110834968 isoform X3 [Zootermopsis nevadensis]|nr:uncharacterized protein LOC110834968 isoform X3 [Zootermopsis nevadensis]
MIEKAETFKIQKELVYDDDIWTSLRLINGYIQEVSRHTNYAQSSNELWKTYPVWNKDMCVKLTRQTKLEAVECSTNLSVICTSDFEEINQPSVSDCDERLNPALTAKVSGRYINVRDGHLEISEEDEGNVIFVCGGLEGRSEIAWIKDGVYLNARNQTFEPSATVDPSTTSVHLYSMQGTYWCEENSPGCSRVYSSNKVNLIFERIITIHVTLEQNKNYVSFENEIAAEVDKFRSCDTKGKIGYDVRRRFTVNGSSAIATNDVNFYVPNDTACDVNFISNAVKHLPSSAVVDYGTSFPPVQQINHRVIRQSATEPCPRHFTLQEPYCVQVTKPAKWIEAYQDCFQTGLEKTPIDVESFWMNTTLLDNLMSSLERQRISYIWLAAERKLDGGPFYYSGPVTSDFNYNFTELTKYNISWIESYYSVNNDCLALNILHKTLHVLSCEENLNFVCLLPSEFWVRNIIVDTFHQCRENCSEYYGLEDGIQWGEAKENCRQSGGDLIHKKSGYFRNIVNGSNHGIITYYSGTHNIKKPASDSDWQRQFIQWIGDGSEEIRKVYLVYNGGFPLEQNDSPKAYECIRGIERTLPKLELELNEENYRIQLSGAEEASYMYGIRCYLNGKLIKSDELAHVKVRLNGYLFCELLTHLPVFLLKSNVVLVQLPRLMTFACQIFDSKQTYNFKVHDSSFYSKSVGSILYYEDLLNEEFKEYSISVSKISKNMTGINIDFHIDIFCDEDQLNELYENISTSSFPIGGEITLGTRTVTVLYVRSTKYCMEVNEIPHNISNCTTTATWPFTAIDNSSIQDNICANRKLKRTCMGNFITGAIWGQVTEITLPLHHERNLTTDSETDVLKAAKDLINETVSLIMADEIKSVESYNITSKFIGKFESLLAGKEVNGSYETENVAAHIFSTFLKNGIEGYIYNGNGEDQSIRAVETEEIGEDVTVAIYLKSNSIAAQENNASILISVFNKATVFPKYTNKFIRISPVVLISIADLTNVTFPFRILYEPEIEVRPNLDPICVFWNEETNMWDYNDSRHNGTNHELHECLYYHLSAFAMLLQIEDDETLDIVSRVGCCLSLICLFLVLLTFVMFRKWRSYLDSKIVASLSLSLFVMYLVFVTGFTQTSSKLVCISIAATLHYFILSSFCWMFVEAFHNYLKFVKVIGTYIPRFMWKASAGAWGFPFVPVISVLCYDYELYTNDKYCWVHKEAFSYGFLTPLCLICGGNVIVFLLIIISFTCARQKFESNQQQYSLLISKLRMSICIFVLLGLSWVFGFVRIVVPEIAFSYLFCITSTLQGFLIFLFFVVQERKAKGMWVSLICKWYGAVPQSWQDTHTNKTKTSVDLTLESAQSHR